MLTYQIRFRAYAVYKNIIGRLLYSYLLNTTPWVIIRTGVGIPSLGFYYCPWFSLFPTLGYYSALGFLFFLPLATIQP